MWIQETLLPDGSGKPEDPIVISSYGKGARPHIKPGRDAIYGIRIVNDAGYKIIGIEVSDWYGRKIHIIMSIYGLRIVTSMT